MRLIKIRFRQDSALDYIDVQVRAPERDAEVEALFERIEDRRPDDPKTVEMLIMAAVMGAAHTLIFLLLCAYYRKQVEELNELQKRYRGRK